MLLFCCVDPFSYKGWEYTGLDMDEEEEDFENDQDGEEEIGEDEEVRHIGNLMKPVVDLWGYEGPIW